MAKDDMPIFEPNETTYAAMEAAKNGEDMYGPFDSTAELMEALNEETTEAIQEVQAMKADPSIGESYTDVDAMIEELLNDPNTKRFSSVAELFEDLYAE